MLLREERWECNHFHWSLSNLPKFFIVLHPIYNFLNKKQLKIFIKYPLIFQIWVQIMAGCWKWIFDLVFASCCNFNSFCISKRNKGDINKVVLISESKDKKWFAICDPPFPKVKLVNNAFQAMNMKNETNSMPASK